MTGAKACVAHAGSGSELVLGARVVEHCHQIQVVIRVEQARIESLVGALKDHGCNVVDQHS
jgi:hypothetical protein